MLRLLHTLAAIALTPAVFAVQPPNDAVPATSAVPGMVESRSIVFDYGKYDPYDRTNLYGFNHAPSIIRISGSRLQTAWFSGPFEGSIHQVILGASSEDGGRTWNAAKVLNDAPHLSDFDPSFINAGDRTLLFFSTGRWTRWPPVDYRKSKQEQVGGRSFTIHMRQLPHDTDHWSDAVSIGSEPGWNSRSDGIRLSTGELLLPTHRLEPQPYVASVLISQDNGKTWTRGPEIKTPGMIGAAEPSVAELPDGSLIMALRVNDGRIWFARSRDHGRNWSQPERTKLNAATSSSNVFCTSGGQLVLTYNSSSPERTQLSLRVSKDGGKSWSALLPLVEVKQPLRDEEVFSRQVCYPSVCELENGRLRIVWADIEMSATRQAGIIKSALVRLYPDRSGSERNH
ncbi:MAG TPA: sialidase family protein [Lacipirellulaceae bacterium]|nr:sialidase family protein [Lacipirellulaceae bacterium]